MFVTGVAAAAAERTFLRSARVTRLEMLGKLPVCGGGGWEAVAVEVIRSLVNQLRLDVGDADDETDADWNYEKSEGRGK